MVTGRGLGGAVAIGADGEGVNPEGLEVEVGLGDAIELGVGEAMGLGDTVGDVGLGIALGEGTGGYRSRQRMRLVPMIRPAMRIKDIKDKPGLRCCLRFESIFGDWVTGIVCELWVTGIVSGL